MLPNFSGKQIDRAALLLKAARLAIRFLMRFLQICGQAILPRAYAVQDRLVEVLAWEVGGWFCACTNKVIQETLKLDEPYFARLFTDYILAEPVVLQSADYPPIVLECEFGFRLSRDLPSRAESYGRAEVEDAIGEVQSHD